jgi:protein-S-isoprenylcysteine O-methyltransferase Ste14
MFFRALLAFLVLPGMASIIAPPLISQVDPWRGQMWLPGFAVMLAGAFVLLWCVRDFYVSGKGTVAPWSPPKHLVVVGLYRFVRNPMYLGVLLLVVGWSLFLSSPAVALYAGVLALVFHIRVITYEERWLESQFAEAWHVYKNAVPRWLPRTAAWKNDA